jgi:steroid delta-isomerase-like uncharacterized protein
MMTVQTDAGRAREVALAAIEAVRTRDLDQLVALGHPDEYIDDFVAIGEFRGREAVRAFFNELFAAMPDFDLTVDRVVADENTVAVKWQARATFVGAPFQGIRPTGRPVQLRGLDFFEIQDGLIRRNTVFYDGASFARQIGVLPQEGSPMDRAMIALFNLKTRLVRPLRRSPAQGRN